MHTQEIEVVRSLTFADAFSLYERAIRDTSMERGNIFHVYARNMTLGVHAWIDAPPKEVIVERFTPEDPNVDPAIWTVRKINEAMQDLQDLDSPDLFVRNAPIIRQRSRECSMEYILDTPIEQANMYRQASGIGVVLTPLRTAFAGDREILIQLKNGTYAIRCMASTKRELNRLVDAVRA